MHRQKSIGPGSDAKQSTGWAEVHGIRPASNADHGTADQGTASPAKYCTQMELYGRHGIATAAGQSTATDGTVGDSVGSKAGKCLGMKCSAKQRYGKAGLQ